MGELESLLVQMVKDLEETAWKFHGYAYPRTIRNILIGKEDAEIAPNFKGKPYHGIASKDLKIVDASDILDGMVAKGYLDSFISDRNVHYNKRYTIPA